MCNKITCNRVCGCGLARQSKFTTIPSAGTVLRNAYSAIQLKLIIIYCWQVWNLVTARHSGGLPRVRVRVREWRTQILEPNPDPIPNHIHTAHQCAILQPVSIYWVPVRYSQGPNPNPNPKPWL